MDNLATNLTLCLKFRELRLLYIYTNIFCIVIS